MCLALGLVIKALTDYSLQLPPCKSVCGKKTVHDKAAPRARCNIHFILISSTISFLSKTETSAHLEKNWDLGNTYSLFAFVSFPWLDLTSPWLDLTSLVLVWLTWKNWVWFFPDTLKNPKIVAKEPTSFSFKMDSCQFNNKPENNNNSHISEALD